MSKKKKKQVSAPDLRQEVLGVFKSAPGSLLNYKQVSAKLNITDGREEVRYAMDALLKQQLIAEKETGRFQYAGKLSEIEGRLEITARGAGFVISAEEEGEDVFIAPADLNGAFHGDRVVVQLFARKKKRRPEGEIIRILKRARSSYVGLLQLSKNLAFVIPDDRRMYTDIYIPKDQLGGAFDGQKVLVEITDWPQKAKNPFGKIIEVLGEPGDNNTEMHAIVAEFGFPLHFPDSVLKVAEEIPESISDPEIRARKDFRKTLTFTIDPADAKDFDDALSYKKLQNGRYEIGVHIADVSHYVLPGTELDENAFERGTSVYLVDRTIPMLPEKLSNGVCSLRPQEEKLCFSAVFELDDEAKIHSEWFGKTVIFSDRRFTYEEAQEILEQGKGELADELTLLNRLAKVMREERFDNGAISFETEEVKFRLDETGKPIELVKKIRKDAHKLIEEFMLLANRRVSEFVSKMAAPENQRGGKEKGTERPFVYRVHDAPDQDKLVEFSGFIKRFGYQIKTGSGRQIADSFNKLLGAVEGKPEQNILQSMAIRTMSKAFYTTKNNGHYGLAFDYYSHFTSPIRRYPDLLTHRLLHWYLEKARIPKGYDTSSVEQMSKHCSEMESKAAEAERASVKYKQAEYLQQFTGRIFEGIISGVTEWGIYVELIENKCEGMVRLNTIFDDLYEFDEKLRAVIGKRYKRKFSIGDQVRVQVKRSDPLKRTIDFTLLPGKK